MHTDTRKLFMAFVSQIALINSAPDPAASFTVAPAVEQKIEEVIGHSSEFLQRINIVPVIQQEGDKVGIGMTRPLASRTNTAAGNRRTPTDPTDTSDLGRYSCKQTNFDHAIKYAKLDAWRHKANFGQIVRDVVLKQQGRDRIMIGWNGTSCAVQTDATANPKLQDVNFGWLYKMRTYAPARVLADGTKTVYTNGANNPNLRGIYVSPEGSADYKSLDALVFDAIELIDEWNRDDTDLVVICGRNIVHDKYFNIVSEAGDTATEVEARDRILRSEKQIGGLPAVRVPFFPENALMITRLDNLSIYVQEGTRRLQVKDEPALDQIESYESVNECYVVEDYGFAALVENIVIGVAPAPVVAP